MTVPYALYRTHGFVSAQLAENTGFTDADLKMLWQSLCRMFEFDRSASRGQMTARGLYVFKHASKLGNAASHSLQARVSAKPRDGATVFRSIADFTVEVNKDKLPAGVELIEYDCTQFADEPVVVSRG
jgi:CRISPR-associated protein Csd2